VILFWILAVPLIASAILTISQKSPVYSVVGLLANFLTLAALYLTLNAEFLAIIQIVVYSGAILMLFVFVIALLSSGVGPFTEGPDRMPLALVPALIATFAGLAFLVYGIARGPLGTLPAHRATSTLGQAGAADVFGSVGDFGVALFTTYLLPFEITALILMVAVIGVVLIAGDVAPRPTRGHHRKGRVREREPIVKAGRG
jgi:NADH-quinone oxidoreductase subunit J